MRTFLLIPAIAMRLLAQGPPAPSATPGSPAAAAPAAQQNAGNDEVIKKIDDLMWHMLLDDIAQVDKIEYTSLPPARIRESARARRRQSADHPRVHLHPQESGPRQEAAADRVLPPGHSRQPGHARRARLPRTAGAGLLDHLGGLPRQSTGYGRGFYEQIDYGGREVDDVYLAGQWMLENYSFLDPKRVGVIGWSHGGLITLMNIFAHPQAYAVAYAGVPVSDLVERMGYEPAGYQALYSAPYHIGRTVREDVMEYRRRSPVFHVKELQTPLLIHGNTNDEDVNVLEVQHLVEALKAEGKKFEYKIYQDAPGGHYFNRMDTKAARESRREIWRFLALYLHPDRPQE